MKNFQKEEVSLAVISQRKYQRFMLKYNELIVAAKERKRQSMVWDKKVQNK